MRILWFSDTPSLANKRVLGTFGASMGWVEGLEERLSHLPDIDLAIAFPHRTDKVEKFEEGTTTYYASPTYPQSKLGRLFHRLGTKIEPEEVLKHYYEIIEDFKPDVIQIFGTENAYGLIIPHINIPVMIWTQGMVNVITDKWFAGVTKWDVLRYTPLKKLLNAESMYHKYKRGLKAGKREKEILKHCDYIVGRNDFDRRVTTLLGPKVNFLHSDEIMRMPFYNAEWKIHNRDKLVICSIMRGTIYKGLETVIKAAGLLKEHVGDNFEWRISGTTPDDELPRILKKMNGFSAASVNVKLLGRKDAAGLVEELLHADMYVHPSHVDNSPNSICEAMLVGVPVIGTNAGGIPRLIQEKETGMLVHDGDSYSLAGAILDLHRDKELAQHISDNARALGVERNDPDAITEHVKNLYRMVIENHQQTQMEYAPQ